MEQSESPAANLDRRSRRRWLQFSFRSLLVLVTLLCVALSLWVVPLERRRRAVTAIEALGGSVSFVDGQTTNESFPKAFLRRWLPQAYLDEVEQVGLSNTQVTNAELAHLEGLTALQGLWLDDTQVTDAGLEHLQGLAGLRQLWLINTQVTDAGLAHLKGLTSLQSLGLTNIQVTNSRLANLRRLAGLKLLILDSTQITDAEMAELEKALPKCVVLHKPP